MAEIVKLIEFRDRDGRYAASRWRPESVTSVTKWDQLVVRENQLCILMQSGKVEQILQPGRYVLDSQNFPVLTNFLYGLVYGGVSPFIGDLYFISTTQFNARRWGTASPVLMYDELYGQIPVTANGTLGYAVDSVQTFFTKVIGTQDFVSVDDLDRMAKEMIVAPVFVDTVVGLGKPRFQDVINSRVAIAKELELHVGTAMKEYGLKCTSLSINSIGTTAEYESIMADAALSRAKSNANAFGISRMADAQVDAQRKLTDVGSSYRDIAVAEAMKNAAANGGGVGGLVGTLVVAQASGMSAGIQNPPHVNTSASQFYVTINGVAVGPLIIPVLQQMILAQVANSSSLVWRQGMAGWQQASTVSELAFLFPLSHTSSVSPMPPPIPGGTI
jgi:membrane protease subunit (stomatin/prohibitin family)